MGLLDPIGGNTLETYYEQQMKQMTHSGDSAHGFGAGVCKAVKAAEEAASGGNAPEPLGRAVTTVAGGGEVLKGTNDGQPGLPSFGDQVNGLVHTVTGPGYIADATPPGLGGLLNDVAGAPPDIGTLVKNAAGAIVGAEPDIGTLVKNAAGAIAGAQPDIGTLVKNAAGAIVGAEPDIGTLVKNAAGAIAGAQPDIGKVAKEIAAALGGMPPEIGDVAKDIPKWQRDHPGQNPSDPPSGNAPLP
jgi:hypothetical protein